MIVAILKLLVRIHAWWVAGVVYDFAIIPRNRRHECHVWGYELAHHVVEGKNGGELLIPRTSVWFPEALWEDWALIYQPKPVRRRR